MLKIVLAITLCACISYATPIQTQPDGTSLEENIAHWIEKQEFEVELPYVGSRVTLNARNLVDDEMDIKLQLSSQPEGLNVII